VGYGRAGVKEEYMVFVGIFLIAISLSIAICHKIGKKVVTKKKFAILGGLLLLGLVLYVWSFAYIKSENELAGAIFGAVFIIAGTIATSMCIESFVEMSKCKEKVTARYLKKVFIAKNRSFNEAYWTYAPFFEYLHKGKLIQTKSRQLFNPYYIDKNFKKGEIYEIYINPQKPDLCILYRNTPSKQIFGTIFCLFFALIGVLMILAS
jgi:hypothetical protein